MVKVNDITITSLETIDAFDLVSGAYKFTLDELQNATIAQTEEKAEITGKHGRKLSNLKRNKAVTISGTNGMVSGGLLELQTGGTFAKKVTEVLWTDYLTVAAAEAGSTKTAITTYKAVGTAGAEIESLFVRNSDGSIGEEYTQGSTPATKVFAYDPETKTISFSAGQGAPADGAEIIVHYKRNITADVLDNDSETYSGKCTLYIDALGEDKCGKVYRIQFYVPKADFNGEFNLEMGENQTVHAFEAEALAGACGAGGRLWTYTIFGVDTPDAE